MLRIRLFTIPVFLFTCFSHAQIIQINSKNASVDYARLSKIDSLIKDHVNKKWLAGAVTLIIKDNTVVQHNAYGFADIAANKPMKTDAIFRIMSQTKAITSAGILLLYEQGKLLLDEPISNYIPEFRRPVVLDKFNDADSSYTTVPSKREITFRHLLTHTSGIDYTDIGGTKVMAIYSKNKIPSGLGYFDANLLEKMKAMARLPLAFHPGEKWQYGLNSDLLGCLIEVISGKTLDDFFRENLFEPLGMKDTYFNVPASKASRLPKVYTEDSSHRIIPWSRDFRRIDPDYPLMNTKYFSGGAGLSSTAFDYAIFLQMILNDGKYNGKQVMSKRTAELMHSPQLEPGIFREDNMGLGFAIVSQKTGDKGPKYPGTYQWGGYYGTTYWVDPKVNLVCLIMTQHTPNSHDMRQRFESIVYSSLK